MELTVRGTSQYAHLHLINKKNERGIEEKLDDE